MEGDHMKWSIVMIGLLLIACVGTVSAVGIRENFQDWSTGNFANTGGTPIYLYVTNEGVVTSSVYAGEYIINTNPMTFDYVGFDLYRSGYVYLAINLYDSSFKSLSNVYYSSGGGKRFELKITGGQPLLYEDGTYVAKGNANLSIYPSYATIQAQSGHRGYFDNIVFNYASGDNHVVGALPSNWTIQKDLINPASTGVYAWNNNTQTWNVTNSQSFYIDADTDSQDAVYTEYFDIINLNTGITVNTTTINSTIPRHQIEYNITQFLSDAQSAIGDQSIYGEYYAQFRGYPDSRDYFRVIASGASISTDKEKYPSGGTAEITYSISDGYYDTDTYDYAIKIMNIYGETVKTQAISAQSSTVSVVLDSDTFTNGAYYVELTATDSDDTEYVMAYTAIEVTEYVYFHGYVHDQTGAALSNATVNFTQESSTKSSLTTDAGYYSSDNDWLASTEINMTTSLAGYETDYNYFTPIASYDYEINITLLADNRTCSGICIDGVTRSGSTHTAIPSVAVYLIPNITQTGLQTDTSNSVGYYQFSSLTNATVYDIWSQKTGYKNSSVYQVTAVGV